MGVRIDKRPNHFELALEKVIRPNTGRCLYGSHPKDQDRTTPGCHRNCVFERFRGADRIDDGVEADAVGSVRQGFPPVLAARIQGLIRVKRQRICTPRGVRFARNDLSCARKARWPIALMPESPEIEESFGALAQERIEPFPAPGLLEGPHESAIR